jgi:twinkle protein
MNTFIDWSTLDFKKRSGKEKLRCPKCDEIRTDKKDKSLVVDLDNGYGKCFYCSALTFKSDSDKSDTSVSTNKRYAIISQEWMNFTSLSDKLVKWCASERKITQKTLIQLGVTEEVAYQPKKGKSVNNIVFNYFEGKTIVNKKYRSADKCFTQTQGGKPILYNINSVIGQDEVYVVEGEFDVAALIEAGVSCGIVSVPNGANDNDEYWRNSEQYLKHVKRFIIGVDTDAKGNELKERVAQRLGRYRCDFIEWQNKDANGDLITGVLDKSLESRKRFPIGGTFSSSDLKDKLIDLYRTGIPETIYPKKRCFGELGKKFSVMRGHLVTVTGIPSSGKSSFAENYVLHLVHERGMKASFFSPEHSPMELHLSNFARIAVGANFFGSERMREDAVHRFVSWSDQKIYFTTTESGEFPTWNWLFEKFKEQVYGFGIDIFVIDAFNKLQFDNEKANQLQNINSVLTRLTMFAQMHNVIIFLVAHPTKMAKDAAGKYLVPTLYDVSGSADFRNQTHDGFCIYRDIDPISGEDRSWFYNLKTKFIFQGEIGASEEFKYDRSTGRFYSVNGLPYLEDMTVDKFTQSEMELHNILSENLQRMDNSSTFEPNMLILNPDEAF